MGPGRRAPAASRATGGEQADHRTIRVLRAQRGPRRGGKHPCPGIAPLYPRVRGCQLLIRHAARGVVRGPGAGVDVCQGVDVLDGRLAEANSLVHAPPDAHTVPISSPSSSRDRLPSPTDAATCPSRLSNSDSLGRCPDLILRGASVPGPPDRAAVESSARRTRWLWDIRLYFGALPVRAGDGFDGATERDDGFPARLHGPALVKDYALPCPGRWRPGHKVGAHRVRLCELRTAGGRSNLSITHPLRAGFLQPGQIREYVSDLATQPPDVRRAAICMRAVVAPHGLDEVGGAASDAG